MGKGTYFNLAPDWVVGFTEGEGAFMITVRKWDGKRWRPRFGLQINPYFEVVQNDKKPLEKLRKFFGVGSIIYTYTLKTLITRDTYLERLRSAKGAYGYMNFDDFKKLVDEAGERTQKRVSTDAEIQRLLKRRNKFIERANKVGEAIQSRQNSIFIEELAKALEAVANEKIH